MSTRDELEQFTRRRIEQDRQKRAAPEPQTLAQMAEMVETMVRAGMLPPNPTVADIARHVETLRQELEAVTAEETRKKAFCVWAKSVQGNNAGWTMEQILAEAHRRGDHTYTLKDLHEIFGTHIRVSA